jgi:hypothetical protein
VKDKKNFVAIRDGSKANRVIFFVHFEANNGDCTGEIKGEAEIVKPGFARYSAPGDPCALEFIFHFEQVTISELKGCGNYRGIKCFFSGSYLKRLFPKRRKRQLKSDFRPIYPHFA